MSGRLVSPRKANAPPCSALWVTVKSPISDDFLDDARNCPPLGPRLAGLLANTALALFFPESGLRGDKNDLKNVVVEIVDGVTCPSIQRVTPFLFKGRPEEIRSRRGPENSRWNCNFVKGLEAASPREAIERITMGNISGPAQPLGGTLERIHVQLPVGIHLIRTHGWRHGFSKSMVHRPRHTQSAVRRGLVLP